MYMHRSRSAKKFLALVLAAGFVAMPFTPAQAGSASTPLSVTVTVSTNCTIATAAVAFTPYDPVVTHASAALDGTGTVTIACTTGTIPTVGMSLGSNALATVRRVKDSGTNYLSYELYHTTQGGVVWGTSGLGLMTAAVFTSKAPVAYTVYGRIAGGQDVPAGAYTDTVTATVNF